MKRTILIFLAISGLIINLNAQESSSTWQVGISGAPLVASNLHKVSGGLVTVNIDRLISDRVSIGVVPFYGFTRDKVPVGFNLVTMEPVGTGKTSHDSYGLNLETKYFLLKSGRIRPYVSIYAGLGRIHYSFYSQSENGTIIYKDNQQFDSYNLGVGLGTQLKIKDVWYLDAKVVYSKVDAFNERGPSNFCYPSVGLIRSF